MFWFICLCLGTVTGVRDCCVAVSFNVSKVIYIYDHLCGLVVKVFGYRYGGPGSIPGTTRKKSSGSGTWSTQPREYN
jgi:hypothetical protein